MALSYQKRLGGASSSHGLDLLDQVQKQVVGLVGSGLSAGLQALSYRRDVASPSLFYKYLYGKCSELVDLAFLLLCAGLSVITLAFSPCTAALQNSLTNECFTPDHDLTSFKGRVNKFLLLK